jgi:hypothetical protein
MADEPAEVDDVERRLKEIQTRHRGRVHWHVSKHTAEMAIEAIEAKKPDEKRPRRSVGGKSRRRKKHKRLL